MRLRRQSKTSSVPGDAFLRAVSSGQEPVSRSPDRRQAPPSDLEQRLLESERRAASAEEALGQIRAEADERLDEVRAALAHERAARAAAEEELTHSGGALTPDPAPRHEAAEAAHQRDSDHRLPADASDLEPEFSFTARSKTGDLHYDAERIEGEGDAWPAPWLAPGARRKRRLFRRSSS